MNILMISYWDFQDHGMQGTKRTPLYFAEQGHKVIFMVHSEMTSKPALTQNLHPNIRILRFDFPLKWLGKIPKVKRIRQVVFFAVYCIFNALRAYRGGKKPSVIYAAECDAIFIGVFLRWFFKVPLVTRYYGVSTSLLEHPYKHGLYALSIRCPADMAIITDDGTEGKKIIKSVNNRIKEIFFWRNGIDKPKIDVEKIRQLQKQFQIRDDHVVLITVSRLYGWKRVDRAIKMIAHLVHNKKIPIRIKLLVVGQGPERSSLEKLSQDLDVGTNLKFVGSIQHEEIYNIYSLAHIFLSFYDMSNLGNPLLEALNFGLCIVTTNTGDTARVISDRINGRLISMDGDETWLIKRLAGAVEELIMHPELRKELNAGAREYGKEQLYTWEERLKTELSTIQEIVEN